MRRSAQNIDLSMFYFKREKRNTDDNSRALLLSVHKLTYTKTLKMYKTKCAVGVG